MSKSAVSPALPDRASDDGETGHRPAFTWWPWRILAFVVPFIALLNATLVAVQSDIGLDKQEPLMVVFTIWAAGNAFLVGMAIGDMGKTLLTVFLSVFAGNVVVLSMGEASIVVAPPVILFVTCATLALEWTVADILAAMLVGLQAMFVGAIFGAAVCVPTALILMLFLDTTGINIGLGLGTCAANVGVIRHLFSAAQRVQDPNTVVDPPPPPPEVPEVAPGTTGPDTPASLPAVEKNDPAPKDTNTLDFD